MGHHVERAVTIGQNAVERADGPTRKVESAILAFKNGEAVVLPEVFTVAAFVEGWGWATCD